MRIHHGRLRGISDAFPLPMHRNVEGPPLDTPHSKSGQHCGSKSGRFMVEITDHCSCAVGGLSG